MGKPYKLNMTRPEFLAAFISDHSDRCISLHGLEKFIPSSHDLIYCAYTAIMEANISLDKIDYVNVDTDDVLMIRLKNKDIAKRIKDLCHHERVRIGDKKYKLIVDSKGSNVFVEIKLTNPKATKPSDLDEDLDE